MGRTQITPENRVSSDVERFASLRFTQAGERKRIACLERQQLPDGRNVLTPWMEFAHRLETVEERDGQPLQKKVKRKGRGGAEDYEELVWSTQWVGSPICLGDKAILMEKGLDVNNCPVCRASQDYPEICQHGGLGAPVVRYAMNVVQFSIRPGGFILAEPFGAQIVVWSFTEKRFNRLDDLNRGLAERGELQFRRPDGAIGTRPYDITDVDLNLGPCEDVSWQRFDIDTAEGLAMWRRSQATIQYVQQLWLGAGMRATDEQLQVACGRPVTNRGYLDADIQKVVAGWTKALRGGPAPTVDPFGTSFGGQQGQADMAAGMGQMVNELAAPPVPQPQMAVPAVPQPTVQPAAPAVPQPPVPGQIPAVPQPTVQPVPPGPVPPQAADIPPAPPTPQQLATMAGGYGLDQFAPQLPAAPPGQALAQAAAPELAAMQAQQMTAMQNAGAPAAPQPPLQPFPGPLPGAVPAAVPAAPVPPAAPPQNGQQPQASADLFAPPPPPAGPAPEAQEFSDLANF